ncbi:MAG: heme-binding protein [Halovenus sp.]
MPDPGDPPPTDEGWYALHEFYRIDWDRWRGATARERRRALADGIEFLEDALSVGDSDDGASALYSVLGNEADVMVLHLRPTSAHLGALERGFQRTDFAAYTERTDSFVSVTEASGYSERARDYFEDELDEDSGLYNYIRTRLYPEIPDATHVCFYPMDKRRQPEQNWYDLPFEERAEHMAAHGDIGRDYGGRVVQMITGAIALDDWEWGVTLWGDDLTDMKDLLYEMRFDPSTSQYAEFGSFSVGRRFPPSDLPALLAGESVPTDGETAVDLGDVGPAHPAETAGEGDETAAGSADSAATATGGRAESTAGESQASDGHPDDHSDDGAGTADEGGGEDSGSGRPDTSVEDEVEQITDDDLGDRLATVGMHGESEYDDGDFGLVLYSDADAQELAAEVDDLRGNFEHYDSHVRTVVRAESGRSIVVSIWDSERAANTAEGFLTDLPGIERSVRGPLSVEGGGNATDDDTAGGDTAGTPAASDGAGGIREELAELDIYAGKPHGEDSYALVLYSEADVDTVREEVAELSDGFDRYDTHQGTTVYEDPDSETVAVVSRWETEDAANTASGYLADLPGIVGWAGEGDGFGTMGMFYTVKPEHRESFVEKFDTVGDLLAEMDGHRETSLLVNTEDENDMFIASQWDSKENAMAFFRSDAFTDAVDWGRDVLADTPRHVFLA